MSMRQKLTLLFVILFLLPVVAAAQGESPLVVDPPRVSVTVYTNWQVIEVTYTLHWLDGYMPLFDRVKPENMSFSPFELDPVLGREQVKINERKYKRENYVDLVYFLRHVGETKGEVVIPEVVFLYVKEAAGQSLDGQDVREFKAPAVPLRYDSVLTKDADDIMDTVNFGSFKELAQFWKRLIAVPVLLFCLILFLLFRKPVTAKAKTLNKLQVTEGSKAGVLEERLEPKEALKRFDTQLAKLYDQVKHQDSEEFPLVCTQARGIICNELRRFFLSYIPELLVSESSSEEIRVKILRMPREMRPIKTETTLNLMADWLDYHEAILYRDENRDGLANEINSMRRQLNDLKSRRVKAGEWFDRKILRRSP